MDERNLVLPCPCPPKHRFIRAPSLGPAVGPKETGNLKVAALDLHQGLRSPPVNDE